MKKSRFTEEQITFALRQADSGMPVADVCRQLGISEATFYVWKRKYGNLGVTELRQLRQLRDENTRLKRLVADRNRGKIPGEKRRTSVSRFPRPRVGANVRVHYRA